MKHLTPSVNTLAPLRRRGLRRLPHFVAPICMKVHRGGVRVAMGFIVWATHLRAVGGETNLFPIGGTPLPDAGASILRVLGALTLVIALFLLGVWVFKRWQQLWLPMSRMQRLKVLEVRSLGARQALYVVGYEQHRFLVAASPTGVSLLTPLPDVPGDPIEINKPAPSFADSLRQIWDRKA